MNDLNLISLEIKEIILKKQQSLGLTFTEDNHEYWMNDLDGKARNDYFSVSKIIKKFHEEFPSEEKSLKKAKGDLILQKEILKEWADSATHSINIGSRTHYYLEDSLVKLYDNYKTIRKPIFECDEYQESISNKMIDAGNNFIKLMHNRGAVLLDTEIVLGDNELGYVGQPDKFWLMENKNNEVGLVITDWKTNKPKNFEVQFYTKKMFTPFNDYVDTSLTHYYIQLPLYARLLLKMLKGSKYENMKVFGGVVILLKDDGTFQEYKIPKDIMNIVYTLNPILFKNPYASTNN